MSSPEAMSGSSSRSLVFGATFDESPRQDLGAGDERPAGAERSPRQLFGRDHHPQVVAFGARGCTAERLGDRQPEAAHLGEALDDPLGDVGVLTVDVLGERSDLLVRKTTKCLPHHLEFRIEMVLAGPLCCLGYQPGRPAGADELAQAPVPARLGAPRRLAAGRAGDEIAEHVGGEDDGEAGLVGAETPVLQCGLRRLEAGGHMGEVVGEDLLVVEAPAAVGQNREACGGSPH